MTLQFFSLDLQLYSSNDTSKTSQDGHPSGNAKVVVLQRWPSYGNLHSVYESKNTMIELKIVLIRKICVHCTYHLEFCMKKYEHGRKFIFCIILIKFGNSVNRDCLFIDNLWCQLV